MERALNHNDIEKIRKSLGRAIQRERILKKLSQEELADRAGINTSYLAKIETGYVNTTIRYIYIIATALKIQVRDLIQF